MIQQYIKGKSLNELLEIILTLNADQFFYIIDKFDIKNYVPKKLMEEKKVIIEKNKIIKQYLNNNDIDNLPRDKNGVCYYDGDLYFTEYYNLVQLPDNLTVNGTLDCAYNNLKELPKKLIINGDLFCSGNNLTEIPDDIIVKGLLYCTNQITKIKLQKPLSAEIGEFVN